MIRNSSHCRGGQCLWLEPSIFGQSREGSSPLALKVVGPQLAIKCISPKSLCLSDSSFPTPTGCHCPIQKSARWGALHIKELKFKASVLGCCSPSGSALRSLSRQSHTSLIWSIHFFCRSQATLFLLFSEGSVTALRCSSVIDRSIQCITAIIIPMVNVLSIHM